MSLPLRILACAVLLVSGSVGAPAQDYVARGDAALRSGSVARAEAYYYAAARRDPRDPEARFALGSYLAARGATRVASVLIEEARRFGGDPERAAELLAPLYSRSGDYAALLSLPGVRLPAGELSRARWLRVNPSSFAGPETVRLPLYPARDSRSLGAIMMVVGTDTVRAEIDPGITGLVVDASHIRTPGIRTFDSGRDRTNPAAATRVGLGMLNLRSVPLTLAEIGGRGTARVGLDWLGRWAPTIDVRARHVLLRKSGRVPRASAPGAVRMPVLLSIPGSGGSRIAGPWTTSDGGFVRLVAGTLVRGDPASITYDPRRGELLVAR